MIVQDLCCVSVSWSSFFFGPELMQSVASCCWFFQCLLGCYTFPGPFLGSSHAFLATCTPCTYRQIPGDWASMDSLKIQLLLRGSLHLLKASLVFPDEKKWTSALQIRYRLLEHKLEGCMCVRRQTEESMF